MSIFVHPYAENDLFMNGYSSKHHRHTLFTRLIYLMNRNKTFTAAPILPLPQSII